MKTILCLLLSYCSYSLSFAQNNYPVPPNTANQLFYIQHSNNHNTYVYEANVKSGELISSEPIIEYRIVYTENGVKKPLTSIQEKMAYGMVLLESSAELFQFRLAATDKIHFYLTYNKDEKPRIYVIINHRKLYLDKLFVQLEDGFLNTSTDADYVLFYGKDYHSGKPIIEKLVL